MPQYMPPYAPRALAANTTDAIDLIKQFFSDDEVHRYRLALWSTVRCEVVNRYGHNIYHVSLKPGAQRVPNMVLKLDIMSSYIDCNIIAKTYHQIDNADVVPQTLKVGIVLFLGVAGFVAQSRGVSLVNVVFTPLKAFAEFARVWREWAHEFLSTQSLGGRLTLQPDDSIAPAVAYLVVAQQPNDAQSWGRAALQAIQASTGLMDPSQVYGPRKRRRNTPRGGGRSSSRRRTRRCKKLTKRRRY
jgi:hypothetical protein